MTYFSGHVHFKKDNGEWINPLSLSWLKIILELKTEASSIWNGKKIASLFDVFFGENAARFRNLD